MNLTLRTMLINTEEDLAKLNAISLSEENKNQIISGQRHLL